MGFRVKEERRDWEQYGILERVGQFGDDPKEYKVITVREGRRAVNYVKGPGFIPVPNQVAAEIAAALRDEFGMSIEEQRSGSRYYAVLRGDRRAQVDVGDYVAWGLALENSPTGSFRIRAFLLRLKCSNGMVAPEEPDQMAVAKSYSIDEMLNAARELAERKREQLEERLEFFRRLKQYRLNAELAQVLARRFPSPILVPVVEVRREQGVPVVAGFEPRDLWSVYNALTYNISHRPLKLSTRIQWTAEATSILEEWVNAGERDR